MRILMISDLYPPVIGGLERHVQTLTHELVRRGHQVSVATLARDGSPAFEYDGGARVYRLHGWSRALASFYQSRERRFHPPIADPGIVAGLRRIIVQERPDIVHARTWMLYSFLPLKEWSGAKLIVTLHDYSLVCPKRTYVDGAGICSGPAFLKCVRCARQQYHVPKALALTTGLRVSRPLHGHVDRYVAISTTVRDASAAATLHDVGSIAVIPTLVPDSVLRDQPLCEPPPFIRDAGDYVLFVGAMGAYKGLHVLLRAFSACRHRARLIVMGTSHEDTPADFPSGVTVLRNVPHELVMTAWSHCALGVVPSLWPEPFGQVAIEAMACGKPVVASAVGGLGDLVVDGETGLLVPPGDVTALRDAIDALLADPARRALMGAAGRERAQRFSATVVTSRIEQVYSDAIQGGPTPW